MDLVVRHLQPGRDRGPRRRRRLSRRPERERLLVGVPARVDALALHRHRRRPLDLEVQREPVRCVRQFRVHVAESVLQVRRDVVGDVRVHGVVRLPRHVDTHDRREHLVRDVDLGARVLGDVPAVGDDHRDCLTDVVDLVLGERISVARGGDRRMRDQEGQVLRHLRGVVREVVVRVDRVHAGQIQGGVDVDPGDPGVRVR